MYRFQLFKYEYFKDILNLLILRLLVNLCSNKSLTKRPDEWSVNVLLFYVKFATLSSDETYVALGIVTKLTQHDPSFSCSYARKTHTHKKKHFQCNFSIFFKAAYRMINVVIK